MPLSVVLDGIDDSDLLSALNSSPLIGRPRSFSTNALWRAYLCKFFLKIRCDRDLIERLKVDDKLRRICGFNQCAPSRATFSRFVDHLSQNSELVLNCLDHLTSELRELIPDLGDYLAIDSTDVRTCGNPNRKTRSDSEARWGVRNSSRAPKDQVEYFFGYKLHTLADARHGIPLGFVFTPGNQNDSPLLPEVVRVVCERQQWLRPQYLIADRGYDSKQNHAFADQRGIIPIIHIKMNKKRAPVYDNVAGAPTCLSGEPMKFVRTDPESGSHLFRCPSGGCDLKQNGTKAVLHCQHEVWEDPQNNLRILGIVARQSKQWKSLYKLRGSIERLFGSLKRSRGLENHTYWERDNIYLHATTSLLTWQATALERARMGDLRHLKWMNVRLA